MTSPLAVFAYMAIRHARSKIPNTWNRTSDFDRVAAEKAITRKEAEGILAKEAVTRRAEVLNTVKPMLQPVPRPGTGVSVFGYTLGATMDAPEFIDGDDKIMFTGKVAQECRTGNCGEMAAAAYRFLRKANATGVHYVDMWYSRKGVHTFVVSGANAIIQENQDIDRTPDQAERAFGRNAIVCDPWLGVKGEVFLMSQWAAAVDQMIAEVTPTWNGSDEIRFAVSAKSSPLTREQKVALWKTQH